MTQQTWTRDQLAASLAAIDDIECVNYDNGSYLDWSMVDNDGRREFEVTDDEGNTANLTLSVSDMVRLYRALGRTLLEDMEA